MRVLDEEPEQFVLHIGEVDGNRVESCLVGEEVELEILEVMNLLGPLCLRQPVKPEGQLGGLDRREEKVTDADCGSEEVDLFGFGHEKDGERARGSQAFDGAQAATRFGSEFDHEGGALRGRLGSELGNGVELQASQSQSRE
jgi:hypothetical protein